MTSTTDLPQSHFFTSQRLRLHYVDWGKPDAAPVVMIHGGYDHCRSWDWMARALRGDRRVIAPDLRGHGDSDWDTGGTYLLLSYVHDLSRLVEHLGTKTFSIVGHSFGGFLALLYAGLFPERMNRVLAIDPFIHYSPDRLRSQQSDAPIGVAHEWLERVGKTETRRTRSYPTVEEAVARLHAEQPQLSAEQARHLASHGLRHEDGGYRWKYDSYFAAMPPQFFGGPEVMTVWSRIASPVLFIRGDACGEHSDPQRNGALDLFRSARSVTIPGAGHWVHHNQLEHVLEEVRRFLQ